MTDKLLKVTVFETREELCRITGLSEDELWAVGFNLDDWDIGFCCNQKLHREPTEEEIADGDCYEDQLVFGDKAHWLCLQMEIYCIGPSYVKYKNKHYYLVHHA